MGVVYKALDLRLDRAVALKVLSPHSDADGGRRRRFHQEARAASALNDTHLVAIYDIFTHDDRDVLVMEYVPGRTITEAMATGPVPLADALDWIVQIAQALALAHAAGIVHRDLKPGNLMLADRGIVKVLDFGLAKLTRSSDDHGTFEAANTQSGAVLGTVDYMSPEQALGNAVDHRTDIFALGVVAYELLTGARPFRGEHPVAVLHDIVYGTIVPPRNLAPALSPALEAIVMRALERDLAKRYQTMDALALDLRGGTTVRDTGVDERLLQSGPVARAAKAASPLRRGRIALAALAGVVAIAIGAVALPPVRQRAATLWSGDDRPPPAAPAVADTSYAHTQAGLQLLRRFDQKGNIEKAAESFEAAIAIDKNYAPAWAGLSRAYWRQLRVTRDRSWSGRATEAAQQAVGLDAYLAEAHVSLGFALAGGADRAAAQPALRQALILDPGNANAHRGLGDLAEAEDRLDQAGAEFQRAAELERADWELARLVGTVKYKGGKYGEAREWFQRASDLAPDSATPNNLLGAANHMLGDYAAAAAAFQKSIAIQPGASGYTNLGTALFFEGRYLNSVAAFEKAVELLPADPLMWGNLADAYRWAPGQRGKATDSYARAIQLLEQRLATVPTDLTARGRLALHLAKSGQPSRALAELKTTLDGKPEELNTLYRTAVTYELCGNRDAALASLETALARGYATREVSMDPELIDLRKDVRYHRLVARFDRPAVVR